MNLDFYFYWRQLLRRLPVMAVFVILGTGFGVLTALRLPDTYDTSARLLVEAPQIPDNMVASTVQTDAVEQLDIIEQRLLTRANMIDIANRFNVFENIRSMQPDEVVEEMRRNTRIRRTAGRGQATLMTITFTARSGQIAANVVNEYVTLVLEESVDARIESAENTLAFFQQEVDRLSGELDGQSARIAEFRSANANALPSEQSYRLNRQAVLQEREARLVRDIQDLENQRAEVVRIFERTGQLGGVAAAPQQRSTEEQQLIAAENELNLALATYSEESPQVVRLKARIDRLKDTIASQQDQDVSAEGEEPLSREDALFEATLAQIDSRREALERDAEVTRRQIEELEAAITATSANGIALSSLERDYEIIRGRYNEAVSNLNRARMSERIETTAQGQRISVIENANVPRVATGPNRPKVAALGAAGGIGLAGAYFVLLELLNRSIRRPEELQARFGITPLVTVPYMESRMDRVWRRARIVAVFAVVFGGLPAVLWYVDQNVIPLERVVQRAMDMTGLG